MTFGERLLHLREAAGMTQAQLGMAATVPLQTLKQYELGYRTRVPFTAVVAIAKALGVSCEAFAACDDVASEDAPTEPVEAPKPPAGKPK